MPKYHTVNLKPEQDDDVQVIVDLLEDLKKGPYRGYGGSVSKGEAIAYACRVALEPLRLKALAEDRRKRAEAAAKRRNNNPGITPGVSRK